MIKRLTIFILAILPMLSFSSCEETSTIESAYKITWTYHSLNSTDEFTVTDYLATKGIDFEVFYLTGSSEDATDAEAIALFNEKISTITDSEIEALALESTTSFSLSLAGTTTVAGDTNILATSKTYNQ
ncbi:MAG: hypothetical protein R3Y22_01320 [Bacteroidales bacterium]